MALLQQVFYLRKIWLYPQPHVSLTATFALKKNVSIKSTTVSVVSPVMVRHNHGFM
jgi:hypothetical protein